MTHRRFLHFGLGAVAALVVLAGLGLAALPFIARPLAAWQLAQLTKRPVTIEAATLNVFRGRLAVQGLAVRDHDGEMLATLDRLDVRFRRADLLRARLHVVDGALDGLTVHIVRRGEGRFNVSDLLDRPPTERGGTTIGTVIERFTARNVVALVEDRTPSPARSWRVELEAEVQNASTLTTRPPGTAILRGTVAGAPIALAVSDLRLAPLHLRATFTATGLDASLAALALPPGSPLSPRGAVSASATVAHDAASGTLAGLEVAVRGIELHRYNTAFVTVPTARLVVQGVRAKGGLLEIERVAADAGTLVLADAQLGTAKRWQIDGLTLEARGLSSARDAAPGTATARATMVGAQVSSWATNVRLAPLELHATTVIRNVDLAVLRAYLPPALPVQPERGAVNATVVVQHDARGTRLGVDAALSDIELTRPAHVVTAPSLRLVARDVTLDQGAVTIGHATLGGDRVTMEERSVRPVRRWAIQGLAVDAKDLSSRATATQGVATLHAGLAGGTVSAWVTGMRFDPLALQATASLRNLDLGVLRLYLPPETPVEFSRGTVNAAVQVRHSDAQGTRVTGDASLTGVDAQGRWAYSTMALSAPSLRVTLADVSRHRENLHVGRLEVTGAGRITDTRGSGARFDVASVRLTTEGLGWPAQAPARVALSARFQDRGELEASGTARLTSAPPTAAWAAELGFKVRGVDLAPLGAYIETARGLSGRVRGAFSAAVAFDGALTGRLQGTIAGSRLALAEGPRTLVSVRRFSATGLDVQWPERITIAQLRLGQPHAAIERTRQGVLPLLARFARLEMGGPRDGPPIPPDAPGPPASALTPAPSRVKRPAIALGELIVEGGSATVVDERVTPTARIELPRVELFVRDVTWPTPGPARVLLDVGLAGGGIAKVEGTVTPEPAALDVKVALKEVELAPFNPYLGFRAHLRARADGTLTVTGALSPGGRVTVRGDAGLRGFAVSDGRRQVVTAERIRARGLDVAWPERITIDRVRVRNTTALLERDRQGRFLLRTLFERVPAPPGAPGGAAAPATPPPSPTLEVREAVFDEQAVTIVDELPATPLRLDVAGARMVLRGVTWPSRTPTRVEINAPMPGGGRLAAVGTALLDPVRLDIRLALDGVPIDPAQSYLPIEGRVAGAVTGDVNVKLALDPLSVQVDGQLGLRRFRLNDGDRAVVTVGRIDTSGLDVDWPRKIAVERVLLRRPRLLIERDAQGEILLRRLLKLRWDAAATGTPATPAAAPAPAAAATLTPAAPPPVQIGTLVLERASARFVDQSTSPAYVEEVGQLEVSMTGLSTVPGRRVRFTAKGTLGGGTFKANGETLEGERELIDVQVELKDFIIPRANPYIDRFTAWTATQGTLDLSARYTLSGTRLEARQDVVVRGLDVVAAGERDEVERRVGLPFGMLVSLLKDSRDKIHLSLPVSGDISTREFEFQEAMWGAVRSLALRLVALPFSKIGSLFVSPDSRVEAVAIKPVTFAPGGAALSPEMDAHLRDVAKFLTESPSVSLTVRPVLVQADVDTLRQVSPPGTGGCCAAPVAPETLRDLAARRLEAVRQGLARDGIDPARLAGRARRTQMVEAAGAARVELNLQAEREVSSAER